MAITIVKGENVQLKVRVTDKKTCKPYNFEGFQGATANFYAGDTQVASIACSGTNPETNLLQFNMSVADTAALLAGDSLDFEYRWMQSGDLYIERVEAQLEVLEQLF